MSCGSSTHHLCTCYCSDAGCKTATMRTHKTTATAVARTETTVVNRATTRTQLTIQTFATSTLKSRERPIMCEEAKHSFMMTLTMPTQRLKAGLIVMALLGKIAVNHLLVDTEETISFT